MAYFKTCPLCGANLDPGELCDCQAERKRQKEFYKFAIKESPGNGQLSFSFDSREREVVADEKTAC